MKSSFLQSVLLSGAIFSALTFPLAIYGSKNVNIEVQQEHLFAGKLKDIAAPYLGIAGLFSIGIGAASLSISEWRRSVNRSTQIESQLLELQTALQEKATRIDELCLSETYLASVGLQSFVETGVEADAKSQPPEETRVTISSLEARLREENSLETKSVLDSDTLPQEPSNQKPEVQSLDSELISVASYIEKLHSLLETFQSQQGTQPSPKNHTSPPANLEQGVSQFQRLGSTLPTREQDCLDYTQSDYYPIYSQPGYIQVAQQAPTRNPGIPKQPNPGGYGNSGIPEPIHFHNRDRHPQLANANTHPEYPHSQQGLMQRQGKVADPSTAIVSQFKELQHQLQQMAIHIEALQHSQDPVSEPSYSFGSTASPEAAIEQIHRRLQLLELDWTRHQAAS